MLVAQRIARGASATLTVTITDADGAGANPTGTVTVGVTRADGSTVVAAGTATTAAGSGVYTYTLAASTTVDLDRLTVTWTNGTATWVTYAEVVGGYFWSLDAARLFDPVALGAPKFTGPTVLAARREIEDDVERIAGRAFVPRYARVTLDGTGTTTLATGVSDVRRVRSARIYAEAGSATYTAFTAAELAAVAVATNAVVENDGVLVRADGNVWEEGPGRVVLEIEHGWDAPPQSLVTASLVLLRHRLTSTRRSDMLEQATSIAVDGGPTIPLATANADSTGVAEVDAVIARYSARLAPPGRPKPASATVQWQSQRRSLFHRR